MSKINEIPDETAGVINKPKGFKAAGVHAGIRRKRLDTALIYSEVPAAAAAVFTRNVSRSANVLYNEAVLKKDSKKQAIIIVSGNANSCTGNRGKEDTQTMADQTARLLKIPSDHVFVNCTGVIGVPLPMEAVSRGIRNVVPELSSESRGGREASKAILTTDSYEKQALSRFSLDGKTITLAGMAKGSGMIHPDMATMLSFVTTDLAITPELLQKAINDTVKDTYNMISVDGDTSTNDSVQILANGRAGNKLISREDSPEYRKFHEAFYELNFRLARQIVADGEGLSSTFSCLVRGAASKSDARKIARSVVSSSLVKSAIFGADANWGRVICAAGYAGPVYDTDQADICFVGQQQSDVYSCAVPGFDDSLSSAFTATWDKIQASKHSEKSENRDRNRNEDPDEQKLEVLRKGQPVPFDEDHAQKVMESPHIRIILTLRQGNEQAEAFGCDLTYDYVKINADYRT